MKRLLLLLLSAALLSFMVSFSFAGSSQFHEYSPVQNGFHPSGKMLPIYAPDRILIKFTEQAMAEALQDIPLEKGAQLPNAQTGIASLDAELANVSANSIERLLGPLKNTVQTKRLRATSWFLIKVPLGTNVETAAIRLAQDPHIEYASVDQMAFLSAVPNDAYYSANWGHNNTAQLPSYNWSTWDHTGPAVGTIGFDSNAQNAWNGSQGFGYTSIIIAILDTGVDVYHPDLRLVPGWDFGDNDNDPNDDSTGGFAGHGTACAGVAAAVANNNMGAAGIAGGCSVMPLKVADSVGNLFLSNVASALYHAADNGASVASMSFAFPSSDPALDDAIQYAYDSGVTLLAATGNENDSSISYPASNAHVIAVGAASPCGDRKRSSSNSSDLSPGVFSDPNGYTCDGERWWGSNYCSVMQDDPGAVDVIAPTILPTTDISGSGGYTNTSYYSFFNGTSCSAPYAAGVAALIKSKYPTWTPGSIRSQLTNNAQDIVNVESVPGWDLYSGYGMVDALTAVNGGNIPTAAFTASTAVGCVGQTINFTNNSSGGTVFSSFWTFGDGGTSTYAQPSYTYFTPGTYTVTLTVSGPYGSNTLTMVNLITVGQAPTADFSGTPTIGTIPLTVNFVDQSTGDPLGWFWDFGDGTPIVNAQNPAHVYNMPGFYTVTLTVGNNCGPSAPMIKVDYIIANPPPPPVASFTTSDTVSCAPIMVQFTDTSSGLVDQWQWDFGDGEIIMEQHPSHMFNPRSDPYTITLTVMGPGGGDTLVKTDHISVSQTPLAMFSVSDTLLTGPFDATFTDLSADDPTSWTWNFGDGGSATTQNPVHTYTADGTYTVTLTATNSCGSHTLVKTDLVTVQSSSGTHDNVPAHFELSQNYPNPFNPMTTIVFSLAKEGHARLEVFDTTGKLVETLIDENLGSGEHTLFWQPEKMASGVYFARFTANGQTATNRMVLLR